jgi:hypothetical protein
MELLRYLISRIPFLPWGPSGRKVRIQHLMEDSHRERDFCAAIVYSRDSGRGFFFSEWEKRDAARIADRIENHEIVIPSE